KCWIHYLSHVPLTGVIPAALCVGNTTMPFTRTQTIHFTRTIRFDATTALSTHATYTPNGTGGFVGEFTLMGSVPLPVEVERIEPTVESWIPGRMPNTVIGHFVMCWVTKDGSRLCGDVSSEYVAEGLHIDQPLFRFISFENTSVTGNRLHQEEKIALFARVG